MKRFTVPVLAATAMAGALSLTMSGNATATLSWPSFTADLFFSRSVGLNVGPIGWNLELRSHSRQMIQ